jgi:hypothetical protein
VEIKLDDGNWTVASGTAMWSATIQAADGPHTITVRATDWAGNVGIARIDITVDTVPPDLLVVVPTDGLVTNALQVLVKGSTDVDAVVNVSGVQAPVDPVTGDFSVQLDIVEGLNVITVSARDPAGNIALITLRVTRDTRLDPLIVWPENGSSVNTTNLTITGTTEADATVLVNGMPVSVLNGNFLATVSLHEGWNNATVMATDGLGNSRTLNLSYFVDTIPPVLSVTSPASCKNLGNRSSCMHFTNKNGVIIRGMIEENATVTLNGELLHPFKNEYSIRVEVELGLNNFTLRAVDLAGNSRTILVQITVDKIPPDLNITAPIGKEKTTNGRYVIRGTTESNATVRINGGPVPVDPNGGFQADRTLVFGKNTFMVEATDPAGNKETRTVIIQRDAPPEDLTMFYIGIGVTIAMIVACLVLGLWALNREGFLDQFKAYMEERRARKDEALLGEAGEEGDLPTAVDESTGELPQPSEAKSRFPWQKAGAEKAEGDEEAMEEE